MAADEDGYLLSTNRETHKAALVTHSLDYRGEILESGAVIELLVPTKAEQKQLDELAGRDTPDPCVVAMVLGRARLVPQHAIQPLDPRAEHAMRIGRRKGRMAA